MRIVSWWNQFMSQTSLSQTYQSYLKSQEAVQTRFKTWIEKTQTQLLDLLKQKLQKHEIKATVKIEEQNSNAAPVYITLGEEASVLAKQATPELQVPYIKNKGALFYTPVYNGKLMVAIRLFLIRQRHVIEL